MAILVLPMLVHLLMAHQIVQTLLVGTSSGAYTGSTTVFPITYDAGFVDVYLNGIKLQPADFTATNGTSITLGSAAQTNDTVSLVAFGTFNVANFSINDANDVNTAVYQTVRCWHLTVQHQTLSQQQYLVI